MFDKGLLAAAEERRGESRGGHARNFARDELRAGGGPPPSYSRVTRLVGFRFQRTDRSEIMLE